MSASPDSEFLPLFDPSAALILRQVAQVASSCRATVPHLRDVLDQPVAGTLPPATLRASPALRALLRRAQALAAKRSAVEISSTDLLQASEHDARAAGLDLPRLRFNRWRLTHQQPDEDDGTHDSCALRQRGVVASGLSIRRKEPVV